MTHAELILRLPPQMDGSIHPDLAYALYGALCAQMSPALVTVLHQQSITPLRQSVQPGAEPGLVTWSLDLFGDAEQLTTLLEGLHVIQLERFRAPLEVCACTLAPQLTMNDFLEMGAALPLVHGRVQMGFVTPCSFKQGGRYTLFPSAELIAQSLFLRWHALMSDCGAGDEDALRMLCDGVRLEGYRLSSQPYTFKRGLHIPAFVGEVELGTHMAAPMLELWKVLLAFAPYSGVGIKPALGMGAVQVRPPLPLSQGKKLVQHENSISAICNSTLLLLH